MRESIDLKTREITVILDLEHTSYAYYEIRKILPNIFPIIKLAKFYDGILNVF